jgi:hypothetical protein
MLTPDSEQMFAAPKNNTFPALIAQHPAWVAPPDRPDLA